MKIFCNQCGSENVIEDNFCVKCGYKLNKEVSFEDKVLSISENKEDVKSIVYENSSVLKEGWWYRLLRVLYFVSYLPLIIILPLVWIENEPYCYYNYCRNQNGESFWYSLLTLIIYILLIRLIKLVIIYIVLGKEPLWRKEIKKIY